MRKIAALLLGCALVLGSASPAGAANIASFDDASVSVSMVDGVTVAPKGSATITPMGGGGDGAALLEVTLTNMAPGQRYHVIAYCTIGPVDGCVPRYWVPGLLDYVHDLGTATADGRGRLRAS